MLPFILYALFFKKKYVYSCEIESHPAPFCFSIRCQLSDIDNFKSGKVLMCKPSKEYANTLIRGLVEGKQLSEEEATIYIQEAASRVL